MDFLKYLAQAQLQVQHFKCVEKLNSKTKSIINLISFLGLIQKQAQTNLINSYGLKTLITCFMDFLKFLGHARVVKVFFQD